MWGAGTLGRDGGKWLLHLVEGAGVVGLIIVCHWGIFFSAHWHVDKSLNQRNNALINLPFVLVGIVFISTVERIV